MMIRNANRNISVSKSHGYTLEKVKYALDFVNKAGRNTTLEQWVEAYNYIRGTNESVKGCHKCAAAKFTAGVRNYAQYGYLTLINFGYKPEDFTDKAEEQPVSALSNDNVEQQPNVVVEPALLVADVNIEQVEDTVEETSQVDNEVAESEITCNDEKQVPELVEEKKPVIKKRKGGRPKKSDKK